MLISYFFVFYYFIWYWHSVFIILLIQADIVGLWALHYLITTTNVLPPTLTLDILYVSFLTQCFRSIRFGTHEAHGKGMSLQLHFILEHGGFVFNQDTETWSVNVDKMPGAVEKLAALILETQVGCLLFQGRGVIFTSFL